MSDRLCACGCKEPLIERALELTREAIKCAERLRGQPEPDRFNAALQRLRASTPPRSEAA